MFRLLLCTAAYIAVAILPLNGHAATIERAPYGTLPDGKHVEQYTLTNARAMSVKIITYGGIITAIDVPDRTGKTANVVLGFRTLQDYVHHNSPYFGGLIGRYANRIAKAQFTLDGKQYTVPKNDGPNSLHGGLKGFDKVVWHADAATAAPGKPATLRLSHVSPDGDQGYPGTLTAHVTYALSDDGALRIEYEATTDKTTVLNLTNHSYFNLAGESSGSIEGQELTLHAEAFTPIDSTLIPTGEIRKVANTPLDFRKPTPIGLRLHAGDPQLRYAKGYDFNWVLKTQEGDPIALAARVHDPKSGRVLEVFTDQPGIQFYSGNFLDGSLVGSGGKPYRQRDGFALETQHFPNSPNQPNFPSTILKPGQRFHSLTILRFATDSRPSQEPT